MLTKVLGVDTSRPHEEEEEEEVEETREKKQEKLNKEEKESWKNNLTKLKMNHLDPQDAIFLVDAFLDECKTPSFKMSETSWEVVLNNLSPQTGGKGKLPLWRIGQ
ncbi:hypothetical protein G5714_003998 [Onychostoma macrolepis]|uniref:Uncharacterized protein n=1 Tax=Onychostoma macrolepis TaxID=369639 RepID=A0A7J6DBD5_9TELE|nr:hypothetical protein G5714_003998 [Onychostoma macrolepis]